MLALYFDGCRHGAYVPYGGERNVHLPMMDLLLSHGAQLRIKRWVPLRQQRLARRKLPKLRRQRS